MVRTDRISPAAGFTAIWNGTPQQENDALAALSRCLSFFPGMKQASVDVGETRLTVWGRKDLTESIYTRPDGSLLAVIGTPAGDLSWERLDFALSGSKDPANFRLPWEGRVNLLHISADGKQWSIWNDWMGSIPVYYTARQGKRIASTLEPVVVAANQFDPGDFFLPGLLFLLMQGNTLADWTIYKAMHTLRPDSATIFEPRGHRAVALDTICATSYNWETGWRELVEQMHSLVKTAIVSVLNTRPSWTLPLSSGLDSRLIAAVAAEAGVKVQTYTWGPRNTQDVIYSKKIAATLGLPWQRFDLGTDYLASCLPLWVSMFGSAMHFHGMYQLPFIQMIQEKNASPLLSGFMGECLAGYDVRFMVDHFPPGSRIYNTVPKDYQFWKIDELKRLFHFPIEPALEQIADKITGELKGQSGPWYQKLRFLTLWGRQNHFTYFQSTLADYASEVATPYINRAYAQFCLSLPRAALDERRLQIDMMRRRYPMVMLIPGTYASEPAILTGRHLLTRRVASHLPEKYFGWLFPELFAKKHAKPDLASIRACGRKATWPIEESTAALRDWIDLNMVEKTYAEALRGDIVAVRKLQSIQPFAYRLTGLVLPQ